MEHIINLDSEINNIQNFKNLLNRYKDYDACIRDIKITTLLGEKCLFEVESIVPPIICEFSDNPDVHFPPTGYKVSLYEIPIKINKLSFKIDTDLTIFELKVEYEILDNKMGKLVLQLQSLGIKIQILPRLDREVNKDDFRQIRGFYIEKPTTYIIKKDENPITIINQIDSLKRKES